MRTSSVTSIVVAVLTLAAMPWAPDPTLILVAGATLAIGPLLLWPSDRMPILLLPFLIQFLAVGLKPLQSLLLQQPINELSNFGFDLTKAAYLGFAGLSMFAIGMRLGSGNVGETPLQVFHQDATRWRQSMALRIGLTAMVCGHLATALSAFLPPLREPLLAVGQLVYGGMFFLFYWSLVTGRQTVLVASVMVVELVIGMSGFFSEFRFTLFVAAIALLCSQHRFRPRTLVIGVVMAAVALNISVFWTWVKPDYRSFLNQGSGEQVANQPLGERMDFLVDAATRFDRDAYDSGLARFISRQSYIDFLAGTLEYVPSIQAHEGGGRTVAAVGHLLIPRLVWPGKPPLESDTLVAQRYTGLNFNNSDVTSISLGYLAELYVDFGYGAILACLVVGLLVGYQVKTLLGYRGSPPLINLSLAVMVVFPVMLFERSLVKIIAPSMLLFIVVLLLQRIVVPRLALGPDVDRTASRTSQGRLMSRGS